mgnify:CR=1 FL=1
MSLARAFSIRTPRLKSRKWVARLIRVALILVAIPIVLVPVYLVVPPVSTLML